MGAWGHLRSYFMYVHLTFFMPPRVLLLGKSPHHSRVFYTSYILHPCVNPRAIPVEFYSDDGRRHSNGDLINRDVHKLWSKIRVESLSQRGM